MFSLAAGIAKKKVTKPSLTAFLMAIAAGGFIAIAFVFYITVMTGSASLAWGVSRFLGGVAFSLGLILVVLCGSDLFTSTVLTVIARVEGKISWFAMLKNWVVVYFGNMVGAGLFVSLIWFAQSHLNSGGGWGHTVLNVAQHKVHHSFGQAVALGILCNILVCLAVWMSYACRTVTDKVLVLVLPVAMFVASGFEHSVANMFMIPMGIVVKNFASPEFWTQINVMPELYSDLTISKYLFNNLIPVTIGNIIGGGVFVGLGFWLVDRSKES